MLLKTASYHSGNENYNALTKEASFLSWAPIHEFDKPARATIILKDEDGSIMQKYEVGTNDVYVESGRVYIEDPTGTPKFDGHILKATHDSAKNRVTLLVEDWLGQLGLERIGYDMREDLDGSGLRESQIHADVELSEGDTWPTETVGANYYMWDDDMLANWIIDQWNGFFVVFSNKIAGETTISVGPQSDASAADDGNYIGGWDKCWDADGSFTEDSDADDAWIWEFSFPTVVTEGTLFQSLTAIRLIITAYADGGTPRIDFKEGGGAFKSLGDLVDSGEDEFRVYTFTLSENDLSDPATAAGLSRLTIFSQSGTEIGIDEMRMELDVIMEGTDDAFVIEDTVAVDFPLEGGVYDFGSGEVDETDDVNDAGANDFPLLDATISQNDTFYFGFTKKVKQFDLNVGTAGDWTGTLRWEYSQGADSWGILSDISDGTNGHRNAGRNTVSWTVPSDWVEDSVGGITTFWVRAIVITALPATVTQPLGTQAFAPYSNKLRVDTDLSVSGLGISEGFEYSIVKEIYKHIDTAEGGTLITGGADLMALTAAANVEHTSGISTKHHIERTRLEVLQYNAKKDQAACWIPLGTTDLTYKKTWNDGAPAAITDVDVLAWVGGEYDANLMRNEFHESGMRIDDNQLTIQTEDIAPDPGIDSKAKYGTKRTEVVTDSGISSSYDLVTKGIADVERNEDIHLFLDATLKGISPYELGDEVSITSTYLGLTAEKYVVVRFSYDSASWRSQIRLHPRGSTGFVNRSILGEQLRDQRDSLIEQVMDKTIPDLYTQSWDDQ